jgi:hypothetical protein
MSSRDVNHPPAAWQVPVGVAIFAITGMLVGLYLHHWATAVGGAVFGALIGLGLGKLGAHRFFISVAVGTVIGALVGWEAGGSSVVALMAGTGSAVGGFVGITIEMLAGHHRNDWEKRAP